MRCIGRVLCFAVCLYRTQSFCLLRDRQTPSPQNNTFIYFARTHEQKLLLKSLLLCDHVGHSLAPGCTGAAAWHGWKWWESDRQKEKGDWSGEQHVLLAHLARLPLNPSQMFSHHSLLLCLPTFPTSNILSIFYPELICFHSMSPSEALASLVSSSCHPTPAPPMSLHRNESSP